MSRLAAVVDRGARDFRRAERIPETGVKDPLSFRTAIRRPELKKRPVCPSLPSSRGAALGGNDFFFFFFFVVIALRLSSRAKARTQPPLPPPFSLPFGAPSLIRFLQAKISFSPLTPAFLLWIRKSVPNEGVSVLNGLLFKVSSSRGG